VAFGGAQTLYKITPDITCLGKIVGGGMPLAAYGGRRDIMEWVAPIGPVYQAGTLAGNPVAVSAGIATLAALKTRMPYKALEQATNGLQKKSKRWHGDRLKCPHQPRRLMWTLFLSQRPRC